MHMKSNTWVLIADSSYAKLYNVEKKAAPWTLVKDYTHPASRITDGGLTTDQPGRTHGSGASGTRSAMQSKTSPKEVEFEHFATELAAVLHDGHGQQAYARIVLAASPHFLGLLRKSINSVVSKLIVATLDKDYSHLSEKELHKHLDALI
jgi:protein required for attachment to host cells